MLSKNLMWTSGVAAIFTVFSLVALKFFNFIKWSPVGWGKKWLLFGSSHEWWKWTVLFVLIMLGYMLLYGLSHLASRIPPSITAIAISIIAAVSIEWIIFSPVTVMEGIRSLSIPFFSILAIVSRFVTGTAVYMKKSFSSNI